MTSIYERAGWSTTNISRNSNNFSIVGGQDEMVGRLLCGLPLIENKFCALPPHFIDIKSITDVDWEYMVSGYTNYPLCFQFAIPYLVASVIYHREWIRNNLPRNHPFFVSRFHTLQLGEKFQYLIVAGNRYCPYTSISATGIPESMIITGRLNNVESPLQYIQSILEDREQIDKDPNQMTLQEKSGNFLTIIFIF